MMKLTSLKPSLLGSSRTNLSRDISLCLKNSPLLEIVSAGRSVLMITLLEVLMDLVPIMSL